MSSESEQDRRETSADIADEIRRAVESMGDELPYTVSAGTMRRVADRIKAALRREKSEIEADALVVGGIVEAARQNPVGNAAAIYAALVKIHDLTNALDEKCGVDPVEIRDIARAALSEPAPTTEKSSAVGNAEAMREACANIAEYARTARCHTDDAHVLGYLEQIEKWAESALSASARNCDRFADAEVARQAWLDDAENWDEFGSPELELYEWLLAPAAERKGDGDGR